MKETIRKRYKFSSKEFMEKLDLKGDLKLVMITFDEIVIEVE